VPVEKQVAIIYAGANGFLDDIPASDVVKFEEGLTPFIEAKHPKIFESIISDKKITDETEDLLKAALDEFKATFIA
jgi:F-type H+-transporting ATPase subunit alpha